MPQRLDEMRRGESDGANIVAVDDPDQDRPCQHPDLEGAEPALVQQTRNLDFCFAGHLVPLQIFTVFLAMLLGQKSANRALALKG